MSTLKADFKSAEKSRLLVDKQTFVLCGELLQIVAPKLHKQTFLRKPVNAEERLCLTLRYLASGDSMVSISYQYLLGCTTVSNIISETCEVIWNELCPIVLPPSLSKKD
ncbi:uncharacterized protein LOC105206919 [Solenopsis invicta]|uniref:uncharacterized protein LOC105206919 n=1 Tax=Solenopsis invicta TaxID=13686 RepID=UPI00193D4AE1|nr:uncharacterized protein LOC105206919 [Solenopsis invicta]